MNDDRTFEAAVVDWLDAGSDRTPQPAVDAVLLAIRTTPQEQGLRSPWRKPTMPRPLRLVAAIAVFGIIAVAGVSYLSPVLGPGIGATPTSTPSPTPTSTPSPTPTSTLSPTPAAPTRDPLTPADWTEYTSNQYGFSIGYPPDWTAVPAARAWTYATDGDAAGLPTTTAADQFTNPAGDVRVSAWTVPVDMATMSSWAELRWTDIEAWAEADCAQMTGRACDGISDRAEPMCLEKRDCHEAAVVIPGENEVIAYVLDHDGARMRIVAVWHHELDDAVSPYGGARNLLESFLETMNVWPPNTE